MKSPSHPLKLNIYKTDHISQRIKYKFSVIESILNDQEKHVTVFKKEKSTPGTYREICNPHYQLKKILKKFNKELLEKGKFLPCVCGGLPKKDINQMVEPHLRRESILKYDLENFFPSICTDRVKRFLIKSNIEPEIADILARLFTFQGKLPQGFPTSSTLANLIAYNIDVDITKLCEKHYLCMTRWIDDIIISGRIKDTKKITSKIPGIIKNNGFISNNKKTTFYVRGTKDEEKKPMAVGLMLDKNKPYLPIAYLQEIEDIFIITKEKGNKAGLDHYKQVRKKNPKSNDINKVLEGLISYVKGYNPDFAIKLEEYIKE